MSWILRPGLTLTRRDPTRLQLGLDRPRAVILPDLASVRRLVRDLARGGPLLPLTEVTGPVLAAIVRAGLVTSTEGRDARQVDRAGARVLVDAPETVSRIAVDLLVKAGLATTSDLEVATAMLIWGVGEQPRHRLDDAMRAGIAHLVVTELSGAVRLGPFVVPGTTACQRCIDALGSELDPQRPLLVEQVALEPPLQPWTPDPSLRWLALGWSVRDLGVAAEGGRPITWSATWSTTARVEDSDEGDGSLGGAGLAGPGLTTYARHPHCGCAWDLPEEDLAAAG